VVNRLVVDPDRAFGRVHLSVRPRCERGRCSAQTMVDCSDETDDAVDQEEIHFESEQRPTVAAGCVTGTLATDSGQVALVEVNATIHVDCFACDEGAAVRTQEQRKLSRLPGIPGTLQGTEFAKTVAAPSSL
jgi:hypothetical protein